MCLWLLFLSIIIALCDHAIRPYLQCARAVMLFFWREDSTNISMKWLESPLNLKFDCTVASTMSTKSRDAQPVCSA